MFSETILSSEKILKIVRNTIATVAEVESDYLDDNMHLIEDLGFDSMLFIKALTVVEKKLCITVDGDKYTQMPTIVDWVEIIENKLNE